MSAPAASSRLSLNTATVKRLDLPQAVAVTTAHGLGWIGPWRDRVADYGVHETRRLLDDAGLRASSLCRGGFLTASDPRARAEALADNRRAIEECAVLGAGQLVMVVGGLPDGDRDLVGARSRVRDRIGELAGDARAAGVRLALEPLHPMYCADRAVLSTLDQALDIAEDFPAESVGVVVDTFHTWWDPHLAQAVSRAGRGGRIASYQVCDWILPIAPDALLSRGMMGDGFIDFGTCTRLVAAQGYTGPIEVEIFNAEIWDTNANQVVGTMVERYEQLVAPHADCTEPVR